MGIYIGYPGVGKTSMSGKDKFIDLESSIFKIDGHRSEDWQKVYCQMAMYLSHQGYKVFVSSHKCVVDELLNYIGVEKIYTIAPTEELRDKWVDKLWERFISTGSVHDGNAYFRARDYFVEDITTLSNSPFEHIYIETVPYDLEDMLYYS